MHEMIEILDSKVSLFILSSEIYSISYMTIHKKGILSAKRTKYR